MKILLAFDSFKGSMSAEEAVEAAADGVSAACPEAQTVCLPLADGGEGTASALCRYMGATLHKCTAHDPLMRPIEAEYAISADGTTAIMDMATAAGLTLLSEQERDPALTTTFGVGEMMLHAIGNGCRRILLGIGGSATNDCGTGMLAALGARFLDSEGRQLPPVGGSLAAIATIDYSGMADISGIATDVICDVSNPLYGRNGAAHVYARQKGATDAGIESLDRGLRHFAALTAHKARPDTPGAGAAGGLGYALLLIGAALRRGTDIILDAARLDSHLTGADLLITGEGKADRQTLCGKLPFGLLTRARQQGVPTVLMAGIVEDRQQLLSAGFRDAIAITPPLRTDHDIQEAMKPANAMENLKRAIQKFMQMSLAIPKYAT